MKPRHLEAEPAPLDPRRLQILQGILQQIQTNPFYILLEVLVPIDLSQIAEEYLPILFRHVPADRPHPLRLELPVSRREIRDNIAEFVNFFVRPHQSACTLIIKCFRMV